MFGTIPYSQFPIGEGLEDAYLDGTAAGLMFHIVLGSNFGFRLLLEIKFHRLYLLVASTRFVGCIFQGANLGFGIPRQFDLLNL
jgi:hypothetical protein